MKLAKLGSRIQPINLSVGAKLPEDRGDDAKARKRIYNSARWKHARAAKLRADPLCQACAAEGLTVQAAHVDHWTPLAKGGDAYSHGNLVSLCVSCHSRKTASEQNNAEPPRIVAGGERAFAMA